VKTSKTLSIMLKAYGNPIPHNARNVRALCASLHRSSFVPFVPSW
jgi:hypothetical protein